MRNVMDPLPRVGTLLAESALVTGRISVILCFLAVGAMGFVRLGQTRSRNGAPDRLYDPASLPATAITLLICGFVPLAAWREWGAVGHVMPPAIAAPLALLGSILCFAALSFVLWSVIALGRSWRFLARVGAGAHLVREGPYSLVRNPIYSGMGLLL